MHGQTQVSGEFIQMLAEINSRPWLIDRDMFNSVNAILMSGMIPSPPQPDHRFWKVEVNQTNGVAIVEVNGVIEQKFSIWSWLFGDGVSVEELSKTLSQLADDDDVRAIILRLNTPGGDTGGLEEVAKLIYQIRSIKRIVSLSDSRALSAGLWLAVAAEKFYLASHLAYAGSLGTIWSHIDVSEQNYRRGIKITEIVGGEYKNSISPNYPLGAKGREEMESIVKGLSETFRTTVRDYRGLTDEEVNRFANGRVYVGQAAVELKLADGIKSLNELILELSENEEEPPMGLQGNKPTTPQAGSQGTQTPQMNQAPSNPAPSTPPAPQAPVNLEMLKAMYPELCGQLQAESQSVGAKAEAERIAAIDKIASNAGPGYEKLILEAKADPTITPQDLSYQIMTTKADRGVDVKGIKNDSQNVPTQDSEEDQASQEAEIAEVMAKSANQHIYRPNMQKGRLSSMMQNRG